jgi:hypothetical protein
VQIILIREAGRGIKTNVSWSVKAIAFIKPQSKLNNLEEKKNIEENNQFKAQ